jgi:hypothetical protein
MGKNKVPLIGLRLTQEQYQWVLEEVEDLGSNPNAFVKSVLQKAMDAKKGYYTNKNN